MVVKISSRSDVEQFPLLEAVAYIGIIWDEGDDQGVCISQQTGTVRSDHAEVLNVTISTEGGTTYQKADEVIKVWEVYDLELYEMKNYEIWWMRVTLTVTLCVIITVKIIKFE